jgi:hypothetical protein
MAELSLEELLNSSSSSENGSEAGVRREDLLADILAESTDDSSSFRYARESGGAAVLQDCAYLFGRGGIVAVFTTSFFSPCVTLCSGISSCDTSRASDAEGGGNKVNVGGVPGAVSHS